MVRIETAVQTRTVDETDDDGLPLGAPRIVFLQSRCLTLLEEDDIEGLEPILDEVFGLMRNAHSLSATERDEICRNHEQLQEALDTKMEYLRQQVEVAGCGRRAAGRYGAHRAPSDE
jgi:hypothetical protein